MHTRGAARGYLAALAVLSVSFTSAAVVSTAAQAASPMSPWSGFYAGVHAGGAWGNASVLDNINPSDGVPPGPFPYSVSGPFGGATTGFNTQFGGLLAGVEGDLGFMNLTGAGKIESSHDSIYHQDITLGGGLYGDITGRLGLAWGNILIYGKGGAAFYNGQAKQATTYPGYVPTGTSTFTGWTAGGGIEQKLTPNMSWKIEYLHFDFGSQLGYQTNVGDTDSPLDYKFYNQTSLAADSIKVGINWSFAGPGG